jgi:hypothetical protein
MVMKSFKGKLVNGTQDTISLHTNDGKIGYQIKKFQIIPAIPGDTTDVEAVVKIYSIEQSSIPTGAGGSKATIDLSDQTLLAVAYYQDAVSVSAQSSMDIIVDNMKVNQDIFVTYTNNVAAGSDECNYYIELETSNLSLDENTVATLKDIRNITQ